VTAAATLPASSTDEVGLGVDQVLSTARLAKAIEDE
jgi:hypothetical protein